MSPADANCQWNKCQHRAVGEFTFRWTYFDFITWRSCNEHRADYLEHVGEEMVDGERCNEITWVPYWDYVYGSA